MANGRKGMAAAVVLLALIGVVTGLLRTHRAALGLSTSPQAAARAAAVDSLLLGVSVAAAGPRRRAEVERDLARLQRKYDDHPASTLVHVVPGVLFMIMAPLQLVRRIRSRYPAVHRWSGRVILIIGVPIAATALFLAWFAPHSGFGETVVITAISLVFIGSGVAAFAAIRRRDVARHREWMIRFLAAALTVSTVRIVATPVALLLSGVSLRTNAALSMALGWVITMAVAEWWIRRGRAGLTPPVQTAVAGHYLTER